MSRDGRTRGSGCGLVIYSRLRHILRQREISDRQILELAWAYPSTGKRPLTLRRGVGVSVFQGTLRSYSIQRSLLAFLCTYPLVSQGQGSPSSDTMVPGRITLMRFPSGSHPCLRSLGLDRDMQVNHNTCISFALS